MFCSSITQNHLNLLKYLIFIVFKQIYHPEVFFCPHKCEPFYYLPMFFYQTTLMLTNLIFLILLNSVLWIGWHQISRKMKALNSSKTSKHCKGLQRLQRKQKWSCQLWLKLASGNALVLFWSVWHLLPVFTEFSYY